MASLTRLSCSIMDTDLSYPILSDYGEHNRASGNLGGLGMTRLGIRRHAGEHNLQNEIG